jgi:mono/diheme cytochrome c family protein
MWKFREQEADGRRQTAGDARGSLLNALSVPRAFSCLLLTASCLLPLAGCRQDMQDQPRMKPFRSSTFFRDGISSRPPVAGTVPRGYLRADVEFFTGKKKAAPSGTSAPAATGQHAAPNQQAAPATATVAAGTTATQNVSAYPDDVNTFPLPVTQELISRGKERYEIFCSTCHGMTGNGDGMVVRRGLRRAASFHADNLRQAPVGHFFDAITNGWATMPSYASQIPAQDRWAIIAYIRALQVSQQNVEAATTAQPASPATTPPNGGHNQR